MRTPGAPNPRMFRGLHRHNCGGHGRCSNRRPLSSASQRCHPRRRRSPMSAPEPDSTSGIRYATAVTNGTRHGSPKRMHLHELHQHVHGPLHDLRQLRCKVAGAANEAVRIVTTDAGYRVGCHSPTAAADQSSCWSAAARLGCPSSARPWLTPPPWSIPGEECPPSLSHYRDHDSDWVSL